MPRRITEWERRIEANPDHSTWYIERFRTMAAQGQDLAGEARMIDAMVGRSARILDAGCGPGRVGGYLYEVGHTVVGVDVDPALIEAAEHDYPGPTWLAQDLSELDLPAAGISQPFDAIVCAGNVLTFVAPGTQREVLSRFAAHLAPQGRAAIGFGLDRGYPLDAFRADVVGAGLAEELMLSTWDLRPLRADSDFVVAILRHA
ncbi:class I SAM-dependent methyltransferase [Gephyromycinifex aptenodytis]|uniref:class I SAM-dependent methyltransferase n=1 Tax=Gephyromycinifex aptenodytis TaxID=2716227 RepID=UPI001447DA4D|nr:methyltransferase domain-containing protein [Gephyromycinifex aptenodytis]